jgi:hypothetical protein
VLCKLVFIFSTRVSGTTIFFTLLFYQKGHATFTILAPIISSFCIKYVTPSFLSFLVVPVFTVQVLLCSLLPGDRILIIKIIKFLNTLLGMGVFDHYKIDVILLESFLQPFFLSFLRILALLLFNSHMKKKVHIHPQQT